MSQQRNRGKGTATEAQKRHLEKVAAAKVTHGLNSHPLYKKWQSMKARCYRQSSLNYSCYGGRGIQVCAEWHSDFPAFYAWAMASGWAFGLQIDRIDVNGHYTPENCRWVTAMVNSQNRRNGKLTAETAREVFHATGRLVDIGARFGISYSAVSSIKRRRTWTNATRGE